MYMILCYSIIIYIYIYTHYTYIYIYIYIVPHITSTRVRRPGRSRAPPRRLLLEAASKTANVRERERYIYIYI